jgi:hypothetical protein
MFRLIQSSSGLLRNHITGISSKSAHLWDHKIFTTVKANRYKYSWYSGTSRYNICVWQAAYSEPSLRDGRHLPAAIYYDQSTVIYVAILWYFIKLLQHSQLEHLLEKTWTEVFNILVISTVFVPIFFEIFKHFGITQMCFDWTNSWIFFESVCPYHIADFVRFTCHIQCIVWTVIVKIESYSIHKKLGKISNIFSIDSSLSQLMKLTIYTLCTVDRMLKINSPFQYINYTIITAKMCQLNLTTACSYCILTTNVNTNLPPYTFTSQPQSTAMFLSCNVDTFMVSS